MKPTSDYIVDLTHLGKSISFTKASSPRSAVTHILARHFSGKQISLEMHNLDERGGAEKYAFIVPEIIAEDKRPIPQHQYELFQDRALASEIALMEGGSEENYRHKARRLMQAYRTNRIDHQQAY